MNTRLRVLLGGMLVFFIAIFFAAAPVRALDTNNFTIRSFAADYYLSRDENKVSKLLVEERIVAEFPNFDQNHGILRAIPQKYQGHPVNLEIEHVVDGNNKKINYSESTENDNLVLKIGDADKYVQGEQIYKISYRLRNVTLKPDNASRDEFYWDVNGTGWQQPAEVVEARVHLTEDLMGAIETTTPVCYTGPEGSSDKTCTAKSPQDNRVYEFASRRVLSAGETLTFAVAFKQDTFVPYKQDPKELAAMIAGIFFGFVLPPLLAGGIMFRKWYKYGRDPKGRGVIVPEYLPPKASVLESSSVMKETFVPSAVSAQIVDLAVRHYLKIYEVTEKKLFKNKTKYEVELVKDPTSLRADEQKVVSMLFGKDMAVGKRVGLETLSAKLYQEAQALGKIVNEKMTTDGYFSKEPSKARQPYLITGIVICVVSFFLFPFGFGFGLLAAGLILVSFSYFMPARTAKGVELKEYLEGLKKYMKLAEAERLKVLQSPHGKLTQKVPIDTHDNTQLVKLYERLLPYAMLFGMEQEWAKQFAHLYEQPPEWYSSSSGGFNPVLFAGAIHGFGTSSANSFSPPSDSSSSGFSGGSSGGGGGGGGGGGW